MDNVSIIINDKDVVPFSVILRYFNIIGCHQYELKYLLQKYYTDNVPYDIIR